MEQNMDKMLATYDVGKLFLKLSLPAIGAQIVNMLYNIVDRIYIGHIPVNGATALTGVGVTVPVILLLSASGSLIGMGGSPLASIKMGEKDIDGADRILSNCTMLTIILAIILTIVFLIIAEPILYLFGASDKTFPYAVSYYRIYVLGTFPVLIALGLNNFISCQGFAKTSMMTVLIGAIINIVLDPIFIFLFNMGVSGAALATIISQAVSAIWVFKFLMGKKSMLHIKKSILRLKSDIVKKVIALGSSPFTMMATESLLILSFNNSLQKYGGDIAVGAMTIMFSLMQMMLLPLNGFSQGSQPIISYNYGAGNKERIEKAFRILFFASLAFSTVFWLTIIVFPNIYAMIFTTNPQLMAITESSIRVYLMLLFLMGIQVACQNTFIALGRAKISLFLAALRKIILLIPLIFILPKLLDDKVFAVLFAEPVSDVIAVSVTVILFKLNFHKIIDGRIRVLNNAD